MMKKEKNNLTDLTDKSNHTDNKSSHTAFLELEKSKAHIIVEILEYVPHSVVNKIIIKKTTGSVTVSSFDTGEELAEKTSPFDIYIQIIEGAAEVIIDDKKHMLGLGKGIIIPAHTSHCFNANQQLQNDFHNYQKRV